MMINCPECFKDISSREFYDHMGEVHGWTLAEAETFADDIYQAEEVRNPNER